MRMQKIPKTLAGMLLTTSLTLVTVPTFASGNPYETFQEDHCSYIAINDLIEHGLIDSTSEPVSGYKNRHNIAEYLAQAMSNYEKAELEQREEIDRLKMEYSDELKIMGVKLNIGLAEVMMPNSTIRLFGKLKAYYDYEKTSGHDKSTGLSTRLALNVTGKLDDHWSMKAELSAARTV